jgi:hypothetical protein
MDADFGGAVEHAAEPTIEARTAVFPAVARSAAGAMPVTTRTDVRPP